MTDTHQLTPMLKRLRLSGFLDSLDLRNRQAIEQQLTHVDFLALLVTDEVARRDSKSLSLKLRRGAVRTDKTLESFDFGANPSLNRHQIFDLAACRFIDDHDNVLMCGPTGVGKSHLAMAIAHEACRRGYDVLSGTTTRILDSLRAARGDGTYDRRMANLLRVDLLILDDFGLKPLRPPADEDFHDLVSERYERGSILLTSNLDFPEWGSVFPNRLLGCATVDRLRHNAHRVVIEGDSFRSPRPPSTAPKRGSSKGSEKHSSTDV